MKQIRTAGGAAFAMNCGAVDRARVHEVVQKTVETYGTVDVVVNNAQAVVKSAPVEEVFCELMYLSWPAGMFGYTGKLE